MGQLVAFSPTRSSDALERTFDFLVTAAQPLAPDGTCLTSLSDRAVALGKLRAMGLRPTIADQPCDAVMGGARGSGPFGWWSVGPWPGLGGPAGLTPGRVATGSALS